MLECVLNVQSTHKRSRTRRIDLGNFKFLLSLASRELRRRVQLWVLAKKTSVCIPSPAANKRVYTRQPATREWSWRSSLLLLLSLAFSSTSSHLRGRLLRSAIRLSREPNNHIGSPRFCEIFFANVLIFASSHL